MIEEKKMIYEEPKMEIISFETEDIITTSGVNTLGFLGDDDAF